MKRFTLIIFLVILLLLVPPAAAGPVITGISPSSGPNNGVVTVTVTGSGFDSLTIIRLNKCAVKTGGSSQAPFEGSVIYKNGNTITATFDLSNKIAGNYDLSLNAPYDGHEAWAVSSGGFIVYTASGQPPATTTAIPVVTTTVTTTTIPPAENSVFFETYPPGARIYLDGENVGITPLTYYTNRKGTFNVLAKLDGYQEYEAKVIIIEGRRVHFLAPLSVVTPASTTTVTTQPPATTPTIPQTTTRTTTAITTSPPVTTGVTPSPAGTTPGTPATTATPIRRSTIALPTPWATEVPETTESPVDPALAPAAAALALALAVIRRR